MIVEFNTCKTNYFPTFKHKNKYDELKPEVISMLKKGFSNVEIAKHVGQRDQWVSRALDKYKVLSNSAQNKLTLKEKIIKLHNLGKNAQEIAIYLNAPWGVVNHYCKESMTDKSMSFVKRQIYKLYDTGFTTKEISEKLQIPFTHVTQALKKDTEHSADWLDYTGNLDDIYLGIAARNARLSYEELTKYLKL